MKRIKIMIIIGCGDKTDTQRFTLYSTINVLTVKQFEAKFRRNLEKPVM